MEWTVDIHGDKNYIEIITNGVADTTSSLQMAKTLSDTMKTNRITKALIDHSSLAYVTGSTIDIYNRPRLFRAIGVILRIRIAEVVKTEHLEHFKFFETVCVNRGYQLSIFQDKGMALSWLLE